MVRERLKQRDRQMKELMKSAARIDRAENVIAYFIAWGSMVTSILVASAILAKLVYG